MSDHLLVLRNVTAGYGRTSVLRDVSLDLKVGGVTTLLGSNGAGKTTTLRAISGMLRRMEGSIRLDGREIGSEPTHQIARLGVAHVPDGRGTIAELTCEENLLAGALSRRAGPDIAADVERMYDLFPRLKERRGQQAGTLSGGEQQMLAIGRALMLRPRVLLLDEPSFGVAPLIVERIFDALRRLNESDRMGILLVEQNARLALDLADRAYLIEAGAIALSGTATELMGDDRVRRSYLGI